MLYKVFTKKGYDRTNMRELAKACEMSAGTLYHYFGSKEEILYSIINSATSQQAGSIGAAGGIGVAGEAAGAAASIWRPDSKSVSPCRSHQGDLAPQYSITNSSGHSWSSSRRMSMNVLWMASVEYRPGR
jgi:AcrR family transcriptional regulator